jgi:uncharacterized BrkB/YihY/UPF0761 family membrane protein
LIRDQVFRVSVSYKLPYRCAKAYSKSGKEEDQAKKPKGVWPSKARGVIQEIEMTMKTNPKGMAAKLGSMNGIFTGLPLHKTFSSARNCLVNRDKLSSLHQRSIDLCQLFQQFSSPGS